ncbi:MAG: LysR family transcriptional regulator [Solirubrobacterales bacterium]|nr:LysR family transcriptional regulator [Solirubrobacterales bacterium]
MREKHLGEFDLNLLPSLQALLAEQQVSRAATQVGLTQPAMSRALGRLRRVFSDELLIRSSDGYRLTPRATRLQAQLADVLPRLEALVGPEDFDPAQAQMEIRLMGTDYAVDLLSGALLRQVLLESPHSTICFRPWHAEVFEAVRRGELDFVLFGGRPPADLHAERLLLERFVCVLDARHPLAAGKRLSLERYLELNHVVIDIEAGGQPAVEDPLRALGLRRNAQLVLPYHASAIRALTDTRLVATLPRGFALTHADPERHAVLQAPAEIADLNYQLVWHPASEDDHAMRWVRALIRSACETAAQS